MNHAQRTQLIHILKRKLNLSDRGYHHVKRALTGVDSAADMTEAQHKSVIDVLEQALFERELEAARARYDAQHTSVSDAEALEVLGL